MHPEVQQEQEPQEGPSDRQVPEGLDCGIHLHRDQGPVRHEVHGPDQEEGRAQCCHGPCDEPTSLGRVSYM